MRLWFVCTHVPIISAVLREEEDREGSQIVEQRKSETHNHEQRQVCKYMKTLAKNFSFLLPFGLLNIAFKVFPYIYLISAKIPIDPTRNPLPSRVLCTLLSYLKKCY